MGAINLDSEISGSGIQCFSFYFSEKMVQFWTKLIAGFMLLNVCYPKPLQSRLSLADWTSYNYQEPEGPGSYSFGYDIQDVETDNTQFRNEERFSNGTVVGSYGYVDPNGEVHIVNYVADEKGYRATVQNSRQGNLRPLIYPETPAITQSSSYIPASRYRKQKFGGFRSERLEPSYIEALYQVPEDEQFPPTLDMSYMPNDIEDYWSLYAEPRRHFVY